CALLGTAISTRCRLPDRRSTPRARDLCDAEREGYENMRKSAGFTLIELMIVIAIIAIIAAIAIPNLIEARKGSNEAAAIGAMRTLVTAQSLFREGDKDHNDVLDYAQSVGSLGKYNLIDDTLAHGTKQGYTFEV